MVFGIGKVFGAVRDFAIEPVAKRFGWQSEEDKRLEMQREQLKEQRARRIQNDKMQNEKLQIARQRADQETQRLEEDRKKITKEARIMQEHVDGERAYKSFDVKSFRRQFVVSGEDLGKRSEYIKVHMLKFGFEEDDVEVLVDCMHGIVAGHLRDWVDLRNSSNLDGKIGILIGGVQVESFQAESTDGSPCTRFAIAVRLGKVNAVQAKRMLRTRQQTTITNNSGSTSEESVSQIELSPHIRPEEMMFLEQVALGGGSSETGQASAKNASLEYTPKSSLPERIDIKPQALVDGASLPSRL